jgi:hypothetical protein
VIVRRYSQHRLLLTCRANDVEPYALLRHVLSELPQRVEGADMSEKLTLSRVHFLILEKCRLMEKTL